ncbi:MAG: DUF2182 domain-containing protein [Gemmatimonadota bacterium]
MIMWSARMQDMAKMPMPGGWAMSMMWTRLPGRVWSESYVTFIAMWTTMMIAMMMPSLAPALLRFRRNAGAHGAMRADLLTAQLGVVYFLVWTIVGATIFPVGALISTLTMPLPAVARGTPVLTGVIVLLAGILQFTAWKARHLSRWRDGACCDATIAVDIGTAARDGARLAVHCSRCCWPFMAILLAMGIMDLRAMALVTTAVTIERLAPDTARAARVVGAVTVGTGLLLFARTMATG